MRSPAFLLLRLGKLGAVMVHQIPLPSLIGPYNFPKYPGCPPLPVLFQKFAPSQIYTPILPFYISALVG